MACYPSPRTAFRVPSRWGHRVRAGQRLTVFQTPILGIVRRLESPPTTPDEPAGFKAAGGSVYSAFVFLPGMLFVLAGLGVLPGRSPELRVNTAVAAALLALVTLVMLIWF